MSRPYIATNSIEQAHDSDIYAVVASDRFTFTASGDGTVKAWDNSQPTPEGVIVAKSAIGFHHLALDANCNILAVVGFDGQLRMYDTATFEQKYSKNAMCTNLQGCWAVAFSPVGQKIAVSTVGGPIMVWDFEKDEKTLEISGHNKLCYCLDFAPSGDVLSCGFEDGGLYMYSMQTGRLVNSLVGHVSPIRAVKYSPNGNFFAVGKESKIISLFSASGEHISDLSGNEGWVMSLGWNESGEYLLSASYDGKIRIWSVEARTCVCTQSGSADPVLAACWMHKGWGTGVLGGMNQGFVSVGIDRVLRWFREASGQ